MATVINVGGTSRSGSTMLHLILGNAPNAFACGEALNWFRPVKKHHRNFDCACGEQDCPVWSALDGVQENEFYARAIQLLGIDFLIDSSKEISWLLDARRWAKASGINTINLFVWKDPVDLAYSFWKRDYGLMFWRTQFVKYYQRILETGLPILAVNYSDLVKDPEQKIREVCQAAAMEYFEGKERFWEKEHHYLFGNLGVRKQVEGGASIIQAKKSYPPEFEAALVGLNQRIADDGEVQRLMKILRAADVSYASGGAGARQVYLPPRAYPVWYYGQRAKRIFRRRFPEEADLVKSERVATIPLSKTEGMKSKADREVGS